MYMKQMLLGHIISTGTLQKILSDVIAIKNLSITIFLFKFTGTFYD